LGAFGSVRQRAGGRLELGRGRGRRIDDLAERVLEIIGQPLHLGLPLRRDPRLGVLLLGAQALGFDHAGLEDFHGAAQRPDLILARGISHLGGQIAARELQHRFLHQAERAGHPP
jgi:hypothetical protein